jgi:hypothetical protein
MVDDDLGSLFWEAKANYNEDCNCIARGNGWLDDYKQGLMFEELYPLHPLPRSASPLQSTSGSTFEVEAPDAS